MAFFQQELELNVAAAVAWDAMRDVGNLHERLVRGFVVACEFDGSQRHLTFANGVRATERIVAISEPQRRVSWSAVSERLTHHNASAQVIETGPGRCRILWSVDLLPDAMEPAIQGMVRAGLEAMRTTLAPAPGA